jgi:signal transduction histidine kinase
VLDALPYAGETNPKQKELVERGRRRVRDAFDLIRDLLDLAAAQRPLDEGASEDVVMSRALEQTVEAARERARGKGVELEVEMPARNLTVRAQAGDIERIFSNLLDNALKYTPSSGRVRFLVREVDGCVQAEVSDTGIGIDPHDQERIFEGFYRTEAAKNTGEMGTGLGLSIVKRLIDRWGGKLELDSTPGKGSRFVITFPCRRP